MSEDPESLRQVYIAECKKFSCRANTGVVKTLPSVSGENGNLKRLDLSLNIVGTVGVRPIIVVVSKAPNLGELILQDNYLTNDNIKELTEKLDGHPTLRKIDLCRNPISHAGGKMLSAFARKNPKVETIDLGDTLINVALVGIIEKKCQEHVETRERQERGEEEPVKAETPAKEEAVGAATAATPERPREEGAAGKEAADADEAVPAEKSVEETKTGEAEEKAAPASAPIPTNEEAKKDTSVTVVEEPAPERTPVAAAEEAVVATGDRTGLRTLQVAVKKERAENKDAPYHESLELLLCVLDGGTLPRKRSIAASSRKSSTVASTSQRKDSQSAANTESSPPKREFESPSSQRRMSSSGSGLVCPTLHLLKECVEEKFGDEYKKKFPAVGVFLGELGALQEAPPVPSEDFNILKLISSLVWKTPRPAVIHLLEAAGLQAHPESVRRSPSPAAEELSPEKERRASIMSNFEASTENLSVGADVGTSSLVALQHVLHMSTDTKGRGNAMNILLLSAFGHSSMVFPMLSALRPHMPEWRKEYGRPVTNSIDILLSSAFGLPPPTLTRSASGSVLEEVSEGKSSDDMEVSAKDTATSGENSVRESDSAVQSGQGLSRVTSTKRMEQLAKGEIGPSTDRTAPKSRAQYAPLYALWSALDHLDDSRRGEGTTTSPASPLTKDTHVPLHLLLSIVRSTPLSVLKNASPDNIEAHADLVQSTLRVNEENISASAKAQQQVTGQQQQAAPTVLRQSSSNTLLGAKKGSNLKKNVTIDPSLDTETPLNTSNKDPLIHMASVSTSGASTRNNSVVEPKDDNGSNPNFGSRQATHTSGESGTTNPGSPHSINRGQGSGLTPAQRLKPTVPWGSLALVVEAGNESDSPSYPNLMALKSIMLQQQQQQQQQPKPSPRKR